MKTSTSYSCDKPAYDVILHIPSLQGGGAERVAIEIARYFIQQKKAVAFFLHDGDIAYDLPADTDVFVAQSTGHLQRAGELRTLLKQRTVHALVSFLPYANLISLLANAGRKRHTRLVLSEHLSYSGLHCKNIAERLKFVLMCCCYWRSDAIIAVSAGVAKDLRDRLYGPIRQKIVVIHNPCHLTDEPIPSQVRHRTSQTILAVGRLVAQKGFDILIRAFDIVRQNMPGVRLVIVGEGPERATLEALVEQLALHDDVSLPGFTKNIASEYRRADLFVCSSRTEGFGNVIVEALSFGLPVVSTACPHGPAEILDGGRYGILAPVDDPHALAQSILLGLDTPVDPGRQRARARQFSLDVIGAQYAQVEGLTA